MNEITVLMRPHRDSLSLLPCEDTRARKKVLTTTQACWCLDLRLPKLQKCEEETVVDEPPRLRCFVMAALVD